jgi:hypothetical protein
MLKMHMEAQPLYIGVSTALEAIVTVCGVRNRERKTWSPCLVLPEEEGAATEDLAETHSDGDEDEQGDEPALSGFDFVTTNPRHVVLTPLQ